MYNCMIIIRQMSLKKIFIHIHKHKTNTKVIKNKYYILNVTVLWLEFLQLFNNAVSKLCNDLFTLAYNKLK